MNQIDIARTIIADSIRIKQALLADEALMEKVSDIASLIVSA